jgi:hypothetical protein
MPRRPTFFAFSPGEQLFLREKGTGRSLVSGFPQRTVTVRHVLHSGAKQLLIVVVQASRKTLQKRWDGEGISRQPTPRHRGCPVMHPSALAHSATRGAKNVKFKIGGRDALGGGGFSAGPGFALPASLPASLPFLRVPPLRHITCPERS